MDVNCGRSWLGTTNTGQAAWRTMYSAVLPTRICLNPVVPCVDVTINLRRVGVTAKEAQCQVSWLQAVMTRASEAGQNGNDR